MSSQIDDIRERLDIVQVISEYLQLKKTGVNYRALCPFHSEKTPSFFVSPSKQIFKCFGCGKSGSVFNFIMEIEGIEFKEALQILARKAGVELKKESLQKRTERQKMYEICELATKFFEKQIKASKRGREAQKYLKDRGITKELIKKWRIGYSPNTWRGLSDFLISKGYTREDIIKAGLAIKKEEAPDQARDNLRDSYDRFRGRIIFPIFDLQNNVIGFGGRIFEKKVKGEGIIAKYINTPNTPIYDKSKVLYGLNFAKTDIRKKESVILVEGYTDVILSHKARIKNIVSSSGTSLTSYQLKILSRYTKNLLLGFDMDIAGESATKRGIDTAQILDFDIKIITISKGKDPADLIKENTAAWKKAIEKPKSIIDFYFEKAFTKFNKDSLEGKKQISQILLPFFTRIQNKIEQAECVSRLSKELNVKEEIIWEELRKIIEQQKKSPQLQDYILPKKVLKEEKETAKKIQRRIEERLLMLLLKKPDYIKKEKLAHKFSFKDGNIIFNALKKKREIPREIKSFVSELEFQFDIEKEKGEIDIEKEIRFCINSLKTIIKEIKIKNIVKEIKEAEAINNRKKINKLLEKIKKIQQNS